MISIWKGLLDDIQIQTTTGAPADFGRQYRRVTATESPRYYCSTKHYQNLLSVVKENGNRLVLNKTIRRHAMIMS